MTSIRLIPCLDVRDGRVVKGQRFAGLRDVGDPVALAYEYAADGGDELVILDITATAEARATHLDQLRVIRKILDIPITCGGGVRTLNDAQALFEAGADKVVINSAAVARPALISELATRYGSQAVVVAIDVSRVVPEVMAQNQTQRFQVRVRGGSLIVNYEATLWAAMATNLGAGELLVTSWDQDGVGTGYDLELIAAMRAVTSAPIVASGGARTVKDLSDAVEAGADAVLVASMLHDRLTTIGELKSSLAKNYNFDVRLGRVTC
jgi:cyclase